MAALSLVLATVAIVVVAGVAWRLGRRRFVAMQADGTQEVTIRVKGKYEPAVFRARQGVPLRVRFVREEDEDCSGRVIFPDFGIERTLPAFRTTAVELKPDREGEFLFTCEMGMYHGTFTVVQDRRQRAHRLPSGTDSRGMG